MGGTSNASFTRCDVNIKSAYRNIIYRMQVVSFLFARVPEMQANISRSTSQEKLHSNQKCSSKGVLPFYIWANKLGVEFPKTRRSTKLMLKLLGAKPCLQGSFFVRSNAELALLCANAYFYQLGRIVLLDLNVSTAASGKWQVENTKRTNLCQHTITHPSHRTLSSTMLFPNVEQQSSQGHKGICSPGCNHLKLKYCLEYWLEYLGHLVLE